jgi:hypothetical protein
MSAMWIRRNSARSASTFLLLVLAACGREATKVDAFDWAAFERAWAAYVRSPSSDRAEAVYALVPDEHPGSESAGASDAIETLVEGLPALERRVLAGDADALRLALRLRNLSDGHLTEELHIIAGGAIRPSPAPFLRAVREGVPADEFAGLLGNLGPDYVDRFDARREELRLRREALRSVTDESLAEVRDRSIAMIDSLRARIP